MCNHVYPGWAVEPVTMKIANHETFHCKQKATYDNNILWYAYAIIKKQNF